MAAVTGSTGVDSISSPAATVRMSLKDIASSAAVTGAAAAAAASEARMFSVIISPAAGNVQRWIDTAHNSTSSSSQRVRGADVGCVSTFVSAAYCKLSGRTASIMSLLDPCDLQQLLKRTQSFQSSLDAFLKSGSTLAPIPSLEGVHREKIRFHSDSQTVFRLKFSSRF